MRAVVFDEKGLRVETGYPEPESGENDALVRVLVAGICNTDLEITRGYMEFRGVLGHEFVGVVESSTDWSSLVGKRVVGEINCVCGQCPTCRAGRPNHCVARIVLGIAGRDGAFADKLVLPAVNLHVVPDEVSDEEAVFTEPLAAAFRIVEQMKVDSHTRAVVLGDGKLGMLVAQVLRMHTAEIRVVGKHADKLELLAGIGIATSRVDEGTDFDADLVVDCTGRADGLTLALDIVRPMGTIVMKSTVAERTEAEMSRIVIDEISLVGSRCGPFMPALRALQDKSVVVEPLISDTFPLDKAVDAFELAQRAGSFKILLKVSEL